MSHLDYRLKLMKRMKSGYDHARKFFHQFTTMEAQRVEYRPLVMYYTLSMKKIRKSNETVRKRLQFCFVRVPYVSECGVYIACCVPNQNMREFGFPFGSLTLDNEIIHESLVLKEFRFRKETIEDRWKAIPVLYSLFV